MLDALLGSDASLQSLKRVIIDKTSRRLLGEER